MLHVHANQMMLIMGQSNRIWHYWSGRYPGSVGVLISPSYGKKVPIDKWMPFVLDNDAFTCWRDRKPWDENAWLDMLNWVQMHRIAPMWAAVPDVVADKDRTIENWHIYKSEIKNRGWNAAFCVQDGMEPDDVPNDADVVFVGGTDGWKFPNLYKWTSNFRHVHCARVNAIEMLEACERLGCKSVDGTGYFRDKSRFPRIEAFVEGHRKHTVDLFQ
jgi:hypothetical protein